MTREERQAYWQGVLADQVSSGQSIAAFCREREIPEWKFHGWKRRLRDDNAAEASSDGNSAEPGFVELVTVGSGGSGVRIEVDSRMSIHVDRDFDAETLKTVLATFQWR